MHRYQVPHDSQARTAPARHAETEADPLGRVPRSCHADGAGQVEPDTADSSKPCRRYVRATQRRRVLFSLLTKQTHALNMTHQLSDDLYSVRLWAHEVERALALLHRDTIHRDERCVDHLDKDSV